MSLTAQTMPPSEAAAEISPSTILLGRFMLPDMSEHACQISHLSAEGAVFQTSNIMPPPGTSLVAYIDELGRVEAIAGDPMGGGFRVDFQLTSTRRDRIIERLQSLGEDGVARRRHVRFAPRDAKSHLTLLDGRTYVCEVIDISLSGAAVKVDVMPALGTFLNLGRMRGRVVRYLEHGVAIEFARQLDRTTLAEQIQ